MGCCASEKKKEPSPSDSGQNVISEVEFQSKLDAVFRKYDKDHNGALDLQETIQLLQDSFKGSGHNLTRKELQAFVNATDTNHDGKIQKT